MSVKRRMLTLAATTAAAAAVLAGPTTAAHATANINLLAPIVVCVNDPQSGQVCSSFNPRGVILTTSNHFSFTKVATVTSNRYRGTFFVNYRLDRSGNVRHQVVLARLIRNGAQIAENNPFHPSSIVAPGTAPTTLPGGSIFDSLGTGSGGGGRATISGSTHIGF